MEKIKVSIGIPAYNEEGNIKQLLVNLLNQKQDNYELCEIIVASDGSSDNTVELANSINDARIKVLDNKDRKGQAERQNQILDTFTAPILVLLNADILPAHDTFISTFIRPLLDQGRIGLVGCLGTPAKPRTFFEKTLAWSVGVKDRAELAYNNSDNIYLCRGFARAFSRECAKSFVWETSIGEDVFSYLAAKKQGFSFSLALEANCYYRLPDNFRDHLKQSVRYRQSKNILSSFFGKAVVENAYSIPTSLLLREFVRSGVLHPILCLSYVFTFIRSVASSHFANNVSQTWEASKSSKTI